MHTRDQQRERFSAPGGAFIAALDQSGGSTPKALEGYGIPSTAWSTDEEMFDLVHQMRARIISNPVFTGDRILAAILFENTVGRDIEGKPTADYLWENKGVVPILKVDQGLLDEAQGVQMMKPLPGLPARLEQARSRHLFGTKMRSVIRQADPAGIAALVGQQFAVAKEILAAGLTPIIEPEIDIHCPDKQAAEDLLRPALLEELEGLGKDRQVIFKLTPPETDTFYNDCIAHPRVLKVVALSGGYPREEANARLARQPGMVASFSRALVEGLRAHHSDEEFTRLLDASIESIYQASRT